MYGMDTKYNKVWSELETYHQGFLYVIHFDESCFEKDLKILMIWRFETCSVMAF